MTGCLLVRIGEKPYGLSLETVEEVVSLTAPATLPATLPAVRGVIRVRDRLVPLVHLGALLAGDAAPAGAASGTAVLVTAGGARVALEVDEASDLAHDEREPVPSAWDLPWASGVVRREGTMIPIVDVRVLIGRLQHTSTGASDA